MKKKKIFTLRYITSILILTILLVLSVYRISVGIIHWTYIVVIILVSALILISIFTFILNSYIKMNTEKTHFRLLIIILTTVSRISIYTHIPFLKATERWSFYWFYLKFKSDSDLKKRLFLAKVQIRSRELANQPVSEYKKVEVKY